jgi:hypothetical protein
MNETCPVCRTRFERAPGYFVGAMYISYAVAVAVLTLMIVVLELGYLRSWPTWLVGIVGSAVYLLLAPAIFRWSRVAWIHFGERMGW